MERASFDPSDPAALIEASLACRFCLHAVDWASAGHGAQPAIVCRCRGCGHERTLELNGAQLLRLATLDDQLVRSTPIWSEPDAPYTYQ